MARSEWETSDAAGGAVTSVLDGVEDLLGRRTQRGPDEVLDVEEVTRLETFVFELLAGHLGELEQAGVGVEADTPRCDGVRS